MAPLKCELFKASNALKIPAISDGVDVNLHTYRPVSRGLGLRVVLKQRADRLCQISLSFIVVELPVTHWGSLVDGRATALSIVSSEPAVTQSKVAKIASVLGDIILLRTGVTGQMQFTAKNG